MRGRVSRGARWVQEPKRRTPGSAKVLARQALQPSLLHRKMTFLKKSFAVTRRSVDRHTGRLHCLLAADKRIRRKPRCPRHLRPWCASETHRTCRRRLSTLRRGPQTRNEQDVLCMHWRVRNQLLKQRRGDPAALFEALKHPLLVRLGERT